MDAADNDNHSNELVENNQEIDRILSISLAPKVTEQSSQEAARYCWVCFATEEDADSEGHEWIKPCNCM